jgi:hypothetical protein
MHNIVPGDQRTKPNIDAIIKQNPHGQLSYPTISRPRAIRA